MERKAYGSRALARGLSLALMLGLILALIAPVAPAGAANTRLQAPGFPPPDNNPLGRSFKQASAMTLAPGETLTYTISLINSITTTVPATVTDPLPAGVTYVDGSATQGGTFDTATNTLTWSGVDVPASSSLLLQFVVTAPVTITMPKMVVNQASIAAQGFPEILRSVSVLLVTSGSPLPIRRSDLTGSYKTASTTRLGPGETMTYTIVLNNRGVETATVDVYDDVPRDLTYVDGSVNNGGEYDTARKSLKWTGLSVPAGSNLDLTFAVQAPDVVRHPHAVINRADIVPLGQHRIPRQTVVLLTPTPGSADRYPPKVTGMTIEDRDVLTSTSVTLNITATDNVSVTQMYLREWVLETDHFPHWQVAQSSGWLPFQTEAPYTLTATSGTHFVGVWVKDNEGNISRMNRSAMDFASLLLPGAEVEAEGLVPYLVYYPAGVSVQANLAVQSGNADLFAWYPHHFFVPDQASAQPGTATEVISFTTPVAGPYLFLVKGVEESVFDLTIQPAGGPTWMPEPHTPLALPQSEQPDLGMGSSFAYEPVLSVSGTDPLGDYSTNYPGFQIYLPAILTK